MASCKLGSSGSSAKIGAHVGQWLVMLRVSISSCQAIVAPRLLQESIGASVTYMLAYDACASSRHAELLAQVARKTTLHSRIRAAQSLGATTTTHVRPKRRCRSRVTRQTFVDAHRCEKASPLVARGSEWHQPAQAVLRRRQTTACPTRAASSRPSRRPASRRCPRRTTSRASSRRRRRPPRPSNRPRRRSGRCCCSVRVRNTHCILTTATSPSARRRASAQTSRGGSPPPRHPRPSPPSA